MAMKNQFMETVKLGDRVYGTTAAVYNKLYQHATMCDIKARIRAIQNLRTNCGLNIPGRDKVIFKPIRGRTTGTHFGNTGKIFVDPRRSTLEVISTVAHELIHEEQVNLGKLDSQFINGEWISVWCGQSFRKARNYQEYLNLPWEIEARERQMKLAIQAINMSIL